MYFFLWKDWKGDCDGSFFLGLVLSGGQGGYTFHVFFALVHDERIAAVGLLFLRLLLFRCCFRLEVRAISDDSYLD